jgi:organic hydroperoxide reductase OsmC/OhrA
VGITRVVLRPSIRFSGSVPTHRQVDEMHDEAHRECFIANSVRTVVTIKSTTT